MSSKPQNGNYRSHVKIALFAGILVPLVLLCGFKVRRSGVSLEAIEGWHGAHGARQVLFRLSNNSGRTLGYVTRGEFKTGALWIEFPIPYYGGVTPHGSFQFAVESPGAELDWRVNAWCWSETKGFWKRIEELLDRGFRSFNLRNPFASQYLITSPLIREQAAQAPQ